MSTADPEIVNKIKAREDIPEPGRYNVIYINDEVTTMEFVIETLVVIFNYTHIEADEKMVKIHEEGSSVVATLPWEMAEQKGVEVIKLARNNGFPLQIKVEPEA